MHKNASPSINLGEYSSLFFSQSTTFPGMVFIIQLFLSPVSFFLSQMYRIIGHKVSSAEEFCLKETSRASRREVIKKNTQLSSSDLLEAEHRNKSKQIIECYSSWDPQERTHAHQRKNQLTNGDRIRQSVVVSD